MANFLTILKSCDLTNVPVVTVNMTDTRQIQHVLLEMLQDVTDICDSNQIDYMLGGGSALGAVRHHGFIPWDDDIDVNLCRADFERFLPLFRERFGDKYWIHVPGESDSYDYMMVHIMRKDIRIREILDSEHEQCGLCLDIFIVENTYNNPIRRLIHGIGCMALRYVLSCIRFRRNRDELLQLGAENPVLLKYVRRRSSLGRVFSLIPQKYWFRWTARWVSRCKDNHSEYVVIPSGQYQFFREKYKRETYCRLIEVPFEGRTVKISADYDSYLTTLYDDYMQIPPVEKQQKHIMLELDREALARAAYQEA